MRERHSIRLVVPAMLLILLSSTPCLANPIVIEPESVLMKGAFIGMGIDLVADGAVLALAYLLIRRGRGILKWAFARHWGLVFLAGMAVDLVLYGAAGGTIMSGPGVVTFALMGFLGLGAFNYLISRTRAAFSPTEAIVTGALIGVLTNPVLFELALRASGFQLDLVPKSGGF